MLSDGKSDPERAGVGDLTGDAHDAAAGAPRVAKPHLPGAAVAVVVIAPFCPVSAIQ